MNNTVTCNNALTLSYPDGFHVMDAAERAGLSILGGSEGEILKDPDRHIIISIGYQPLGGLSSLLLGVKDAADRAEKVLKKAMEAFDYRWGENAARNIGGKEAVGFSYEYTAQGVPMYGELFVVKSNKHFYYLYIYARKELKEDSLQIWNDILDTAAWV